MSSTNIFTPFSEQELIPQEEKLEVIKKGKQFGIGVPKETCLNERRTCITPDAVQVLVNHGHEVIIESGAGEGSFFTDLQYSDSGAKITNNPQEAFTQDLVLKINPPTTEEIEFLTAITASALRTSDSNIHLGFCLIHVTNTSEYDAILLVFIDTISLLGNILSK